MKDGFMAGEDLIMEPNALKVSLSSNHETNTIGALDHDFAAQKVPEA